MAKLKFAFVCNECGYASPRWLGRCPDCGQFNTMIEEQQASSLSASPLLISNNKATPITEIESAQLKRTKSGIAELDRLLGGGIVNGCLVLLGGAPGIGKSTLLLQLAARLANKKLNVLIASGEESAEQTKIRADRLGKMSSNLYVLAENNLEAIERQLEDLAVDILIIDSIQTMFLPHVGSAPGSVSQVRECTTHLMRIAKGKNTVVFIVGHVTKEGSLAGPRVLEHMVDTVLYFEGDSFHNHRIIRAVKNRFGSTNEIAIFQMGENGLEEVTNPSEVFISGKANASGSVITAAVEGSRPILVELQALICNSYYSNPRRQTSGLDYNRLAIIIAVLEKRAGLALADKDVYANVAGGLRVDEAAADLAVALSIASNLKDNVVPADTIVFGELGLSGEVRPVGNIELRLKEASKLGIKKAILPNSKIKFAGIELCEVENINQALEFLN